MSARLVAAALGATIALGPGPARAGVTEDMAKHLDGDATAVVRLELDQLIKTANLLAKLKVPEVGAALMLVGFGGSGLLGFNPLAPSGWKKVGLDPTAPILISLGALDHAAADKAVNAARKSGKVPKRRMFWRSRALLRTTDPRKSAQALRAVAGKLARLVPDVQPVWPSNSTKVAALLGASSAGASYLVRSLRGQGTVAMARLPFDVFAFTRVRGNLVVIDLVRGFRPGPIVWKRDKLALLDVLRRKPAKSGYAGMMKARPAAARIGRAGSVLWVDAERLVRLDHALRQGTYLQQLAAGAKTRPLRALGACADFVTMARQGAFKDVAIASLVKGAAVEGSITWSSHTAFGMGAPFAVKDDRLLSGTVSASGPVAAGALYMRGWYPLQALPRPAVMKSDWKRVWVTAAHCGVGPGVAVHLFGWPLQIGTALDDISTINKDAKTLVAGARNLAFSAKTVSLDLKKVRVAIEGSVDPAADKVARKLLARVFGVTRSHKSAARSYTSFGKGPLRPFAYRTASKVNVIGAGYRPQAVAWYLSGAPTPTRTATNRGVLGWVDADAGRLIQQLGLASRGPKALTKMWSTLGQKLGLFRSRLDVTQDLVESTWSLAIK